MGVVIPPAGPPITLPLGWLLPGGQVWTEMFSFLHIDQVQLEAGLEVEGVFWENLDRRVHSNGTIVYKVMYLSLQWLYGSNVQEVGVVEHGEFLVGSLADGGQVTLLPSLGGAQVGS